MPRRSKGAEPRASRAYHRVLFLEDLDRFDAATALYAPDERDDADATAALRDRVREAVRCALTPRQRALVELHFFEGLSQGAIARRLGVAQQVVHKQLYGAVRRGRRVGGALPRLREALGPLVAARNRPRA